MPMQLGTPYRGSRHPRMLGRGQTSLVANSSAETTGTVATISASSRWLSSDRFPVGWK
jgi:hypothetical protein